MKGSYYGWITQPKNLDVDTIRPIVRAVAEWRAHNYTWAEFHTYCREHTGLTVIDSRRIMRRTQQRLGVCECAIAGLFAAAVIVATRDAIGRLLPAPQSQSMEDTV